MKLEDGREAPSKARKKGAKRLEFLVYLKEDKFSVNYKIYLTTGFLTQLCLQNIPW